MSVVYSLTVSYAGPLADIVELYEFASGGDQSQLKARLQAGGGESPQVHVFIDDSSRATLDTALELLGHVDEKARGLGAG